MCAQFPSLVSAVVFCMLIVGCSRNEAPTNESTAPVTTSAAAAAPRPSASAAQAIVSAAPTSIPSAELIAPAPDDDGSTLPNPAPSAKPPPLDAGAPSDEETSESEYCDTEHPKPPSKNRLYAIFQKFRVPLGKNLGMGTLRALEDSRVTKGVRHGTHPMLPPCDLLPTRIELSDESGKTLQVEKKWPETDIVMHEMGPGATIIETIERVQCLASCWCGDGHAFWRIEDGKLIRHSSRVVEKIPKGTKPDVGAIIEARAVTHGCYEGSAFEKDAQGRLGLVINRSAMGFAVYSKERHFFEDGEWKVSIGEFKSPGN